MPFDTVFSVGKSRIRIDEGLAYVLLWSSVIVEVAIDVDGIPQAAITDEPALVQAFGLEAKSCSG